MDIICELLGLTEFCGENLGGVATVQAIRVGNIDTIPAATNKIISSDIIITPGTSFKTYEFPPDSVEYKETGRPTQNGVAYTHRISAKRPRMQALAAAEIARLDEGWYVVIFTDYNAERRIIGSPERPILFSNSGGTGRRRSDENGYNWKFEGKAQGPASFLDASVNIIESNAADYDATDYDSTDYYTTPI